MRISAATREAVEEAMHPLEDWAHRCHEASLHLVRSGVIFPECRVARGHARGVGFTQHSWVVVGEDVYNPRAIIDPTWWSYVHPERPLIRFVTVRTTMDADFTPHGKGHLLRQGPPASGNGEEIIPEGLDGSALHFIDRMIRPIMDGEPLDRRFWMGLFNGPMQGWPSRAVIEAAYRDDRFRALIPIDIVGHLTDHNPGGLYLPERAEVSR